MKKKLSAILILCVTLVCVALFCGCSETNPYFEIPDKYYRITDMEVSIDASAGDRSMRIVEKYTFVFTRDPSGPSHGFIRDFAVNSGEKIRDLKVYDASDFSDSYEIYHESSGILSVKVGSSERYVALDTPLKCTMEYTMITPEHAVYKNALAVNAIGQGWSCAIDHANIKVILPAETIAVPDYFCGRWGDDTDAVVNGFVSAVPVMGQKEYSFELIRPLEAYHGLTLYYYMPDGTFGVYVDTGLFVLIGAAAVVVALAVLLKLTAGKSAPLAPVVQYYPPKHAGAGEKELPMDPLDMGYLIDNTCQGSDVTSLIFYFASKGYLEIIPPEDKKSYDSFELKKLCDPPQGLPKYQYVLFNKLFASGNNVTVKELTNKTYTAVEQCKTQIKARYSGRLYDNKSKALSVVMCVLTALFAFLAVFLSGLRINTSYFNVTGIAVIAPIIVSNLIGVCVVNYRHKMSKAKNIALFVFFVIATLLASLLIVFVTDRDVFGYAETAITVVAVVACCVISPLIARRTKMYTEELDNVLGFKEFLVSAEKDKLEMLLEENPQYYYDILPYANVLGVSDKWEDKFKGLTLEPPTFYRSNVAFDLLWFNLLYRRSFRAYSTAAVSRPTSSGSRSGGGGGGRHGGFSGGGFGGGGGRRW